MIPETRAPLSTVDISEDTPLPPSSATPFRTPAAVLDPATLAEAIRPNPTPLAGDGARRYERPLLESIADTEQPPRLRLLPRAATSTEAPASGVRTGETWWTRTSGVRPIARRPVGATAFAPAAEALSDDLHGGELARARALAAVVTGAAIAGAVLLQLVAPTYDPLHVATTAVVVAALGSALFLLVVAALYDAVSRRVHVALGVVSAAALLSVMAHGGPASPVALLLAALIHHHAATPRPRHALGITLLASLGCAAVGGLIGRGAIVPGGPFALAPATSLAWALCLAAFIGVTGVSRHRHALRAAHAAQRSHARVGRREALLDEAYAALAHVERPREGRRSGTLVGRFSVGRLLAESPRAEVYEGRAADGSWAALKLFRPELDRREAMTMVERAASASVLGAGIARLLDYGALADGTFFLASELLGGPNLARQLREPWGITNTESLILLGELAEALERVHGGKLAHGNIKPENIVRDGAGRWRLTDFGVPAAPSRHAIPTPRYAAPEPALSPSDPKNDVFALAAVAYRLILRCPPLCSSGPLDESALSRPVRPSALAPVHRDVDAVFALGLATDPHQRLDSAASFVDLLRLALDGRLPDHQRARAAALLDAEPWAEPAPLAT